MSPFLNAFLPKVGYNQKMARAIVHGPQRYGGAGYAHHYGEQNASKLHELVAHMRHDGDVGTLMLLMISHL